MKLNKHELDFILKAVRTSEGVYDFSVTNKEFKRFYGISIDKIGAVLDALEIKILNEQNKRISNKSINRSNKGSI